MQTVSFAGSSYNIPNTRGDRPWSGLSDFVIAAASKAINTAGGNFTLLADINFGATFGLVSTYYKSRTANVASAGQIRLANADTIKFRNTLNDGDLSVAISSNRLTFGGSRLIIAGAAEIVNADVSASAAIAYSKLALTGSIVNADVGASAAIVYSKLSLTGSIVNADITAGTLTNTAINASAAIVLTKLAALTNHSRALVSDSSGFITEATTTSTEIGYVNGVTSAIQTQFTGKASTDLSNVASVSANVPMNTHKFTGLAAGTTNGDSVRYEQLGGFQAAVQATTTTATSTTSSTFQATALTASITPTSASHRIKITATGTLRTANGTISEAHATIERGTTNLAGAAGFNVTDAGIAASQESPCTMVFIDSPATTSSTTYTVYIRNADNSTNVSWNANTITSVIILEEII